MKPSQLSRKKVGILACAFIFLWVFSSSIDIAFAQKFKLSSVSAEKYSKYSHRGKWHNNGFKKVQLECGATIGPNEKIKLMNDLGACEADPALTITGPATFNLNGHTVSGNGDNDGILIVGKGAQIMNGTVTNFYLGLAVAGEGQHQILNISAINNVDAGFYVGSDDNRLMGNVSDYNWEGYFVRGNKNRFLENKAIGNEREGFDIRGDHNKFFSNTSDANKSDSIKIYGNMNILVKNTASNDEDDGFVVKGDDNRLIDNRAIGNGEDGFDVIGSKNTFKKNSAKDNVESGIVIGYDSTENKIIRNAAMGNGNIDIEAGNDENCENNFWKKNRFTTSNLNCLK